jgi:hypothetical protein
LYLHALFANPGFDTGSFLRTPRIPVLQYPAMLPLFSLLLELLGELLNLALALPVKIAQLIIHNHAVDPIRVVQKAFKMVQLLLHSRDRTIFLLDQILEAIFLIAQSCEFLFQLGAIPIELQELFALLYGLFFRISKDGSQGAQ